MEMKERSREGRIGSDWEVERKFFENRKWDVGEVERRRKEGNMFGDLLKKDREIQWEERRRRIRKSRYNSCYEAIRSEGIPEYLMKS